MGKTICTGSNSTEKEALEWLKKHGARIEHAAHVDVICLPGNARVERDGQWWSHTISFASDEDHYVSIELDVDADETTLRLVDNSCEDDDEEGEE